MIFFYFFVFLISLTTVFPYKNDDNFLNDDLYYMDIGQSCQSSKSFEQKNSVKREKKNLDLHGNRDNDKMLPCDGKFEGDASRKSGWCTLPGESYPWHAVRRFVFENQGLIRRMYGDVREISLLRMELLGDEKKSGSSKNQVAKGFNNNNKKEQKEEEFYQELFKPKKDEKMEKIEEKIEKSIETENENVENEEEEVDTTTDENLENFEENEEAAVTTTENNEILYKSLEKIDQEIFGDAKIDVSIEKVTTKKKKIKTKKIVKLEKPENACPVHEEVVAPYWANNTRGEILALLNLYPFEQYIHWEKCSHEQKQMNCKAGCRCEQQYRLHRLLAFDPSNECRGIFSDWFKFPSCCVCKCYQIEVVMEDYVSEELLENEISFDEIENFSENENKNELVSTEENLENNSENNNKTTRNPRIVFLNGNEDNHFYYKYN